MDSGASRQFRGHQPEAIFLLLEWRAESDRSRVAPRFPQRAFSRLFGARALGTGEGGQEKVAPCMVVLVAGAVVPDRLLLRFSARALPPSDRARTAHLGRVPGF